MFNKTKYEKENILTIVGEEQRTGKIAIYVRPNPLRVLLSQWRVFGLALLGVGYIKEFPGCCGIGVLTGIDVSECSRNRGVAKIIVDEAIDLMTRLNYTRLVATVNNKTPEMHHILNSKGFIPVDTFNNKKTSNDVTIYIYKNETK